MITQKKKSSLDFFLFLKNQNFFGARWKKWKVCFAVFGENVFSIFFVQIFPFLVFFFCLAVSKNNKKIILKIKQITKFGFFCFFRREKPKKTLERRRKETEKRK